MSHASAYAAGHFSCSLNRKSLRFLTLVPPQDPKQRSIMEMFQRSFTEDDDVDEAALLEAANDWEDDCDLPGNSRSAPHKSSVGPTDKSIKAFFGR